MNLHGTSAHKPASTEKLVGTLMEKSVPNPLGSTIVKEECVLWMYKGKKICSDYSVQFFGILIPFTCLIY